MQDTAYLTVASIMRYIFVLAMIYILIRITIQSIREYVAIKRAKYWIDGVFAATVRFVAPTEFVDKMLSLEKKNSIGSSKGCDIYIKGCELKKKHAIIVQTKHGAYMEVKNNADAKLNGDNLGLGQYPLKDGDVITLCDVEFIFNTRLKKTEEEHE